MNNEEPPKCELEDHFILRLPLEQAKLVRKVLKKKPKKLKKYVSIELDDDLRHGIVKVHKKYLHAKLFDLPTIVESNKTVDGVHLFKTADICQMLICQENEYVKETEPERKETKTNRVKVNKVYLSQHGYSLPMKNVRKFRFRKTLRNKEDAEAAADIEKEVLWLLRMDNEAVSTKFEFIYDNKLNQAPNSEVNELSLFGEKLSDIDSDKESGSGSASSSCEINDIMDFTN